MRCCNRGGGELADQRRRESETNFFHVRISRNTSFGRSREDAAAGALASRWGW